MRPSSAVATFGLGLLATHGFGLSLVPALLPDIAQSLGAGYAQLGLAISAGLVAYSVGALSAGWLIERIPNRTLLLGTFAVPALALSVASQASSPAWIAVAAIVLGLNGSISWPTTIHIVASSVAVESRTAVLGAIGSGVGLGWIVNGLLVRYSGDLFSWRGAMLIGAAITLVPFLAALAVVPSNVARPIKPSGPGRGFRMAATSTAGLVVILAGVAAGLFGAPFVSFLSVVAVDEFGSSSQEAALLWGLVGGAGIVAAPLFGRLGQARTPLLALVAGAALFVTGFASLAIVWTYPILVVGAVMFTAYYYPMWGLVGSLATTALGPGVAVRAVALGLVGAAIGGSIGNIAVGAWYDAGRSFRGPLTLMTIGMTVVLAVFYILYRSEHAEADAGRG